MRQLDQRYSLGPCIGRGGVGEVYQGWQQALDRPVAIKLLRKELTRSPGAVARFEREARTTSLLNHPNVVTVIDVGEAEDGRRFVAMELLEGETLGTLLDRAGRLSPDRALAIASQIARGMGAGQGVGLVHRDLKPDNIFILDQDHVKILDFGLATLLDEPREADDAGTAAPPRREPRSLTPVPERPARTQADPTPLIEPTADFLPLDPGETDDHALGPRSEEETTRAARVRADLARSRLTRPGALMGTPRYMAPEQVLGWAVDHRSDLYAFGVIFFEMLVGRTPFSGPGPRDFMRQHLHVPAPDLSTLVEGVPPAMVRIVRKLLQKSPSDRFSDWAALSEALRQLTAARTPGSLLAGVGVERDDPLPAAPFRFLHPFTSATRAIFFGRDGDARRFRSTWEHADRPAIVLLSGASGVGKTSFLSARVVPGLEDTGHTVVVVRGTARPLEQLTQTLERRLERLGAPRPGRPLPSLLDALVEVERRPVAVALDQVEEVFTQGAADAAQLLQAGLASVLAGGDGSVRFILSLREDYLGAVLRALHTLPLDSISRTLPLRPLESADIREALEGPGRPGLPVEYVPFRYEDGLLDEIVADLLSDQAGETSPRIQAVGSRLWEMMRDEGDGQVIRRDHYRQRLGGARGILARVLDEAVGGLGETDQGLAKEMLRALTHLPGSPTSRPAPESELVGNAVNPERRRAVLRDLEDRWRIIHGFLDARWPGERTYRVAHEALIFRIQQYGEEGTGRNRARQLFHQGYNLWLQGGKNDDDLLPEQHFEEVRREVEDLVLRSAEEREFYDRSRTVYDDSFVQRHVAERRRALWNALQMVILPTFVLASGFLLGQLATGYIAMETLWVRTLSALNAPKADHRAAVLRAADLRGAYLHEANLNRADLREADLTGAHLEAATLRRVRATGARFDKANLRGAQLSAQRLWDASFREADLRRASLEVDHQGADFTLALFDRTTTWGEDGPPPLAVGPGGRAAGLRAPGTALTKLDLGRIDLSEAQLTAAIFDHSVLAEAQLPGANLEAASFVGTQLDGADLSGARLRRAVLEGAQLARADLQDADLQEANLQGAILTEARLDGAQLCGTDLRDTDLTRASAIGATVCDETLWPETGPLDTEPPRRRRRRR
jgi:serine/threonine protein kinase/uncharacterized protein YjbI with pentapeptide repeats